MESRNIGICSWSLAEMDEKALVGALKSVGLKYVQLDLNPYVDGRNADAAARVFKNASIGLLSGMIGFRGEDYSTIRSIIQTGGFVPDDLVVERVERAISRMRQRRTNLAKRGAWKCRQVTVTSIGHRS